MSITEKDLRSRLLGLEKDRDTIATILATRTGKGLERIKNDMLNEVILTAPEARDYGFVTEINPTVFDPAQEILQIISPF